jgi:hypothetical protein
MMDEYPAHWENYIDGLIKRQLRLKDRQDPEEDSKAVSGIHLNSVNILIKMA